MKKALSFALLSCLGVISTLPMIKIVHNHLCITRQWRSLHEEIFVLKKTQDKNLRCVARNKQLLLNREKTTSEQVLQLSQELSLLQEERTWLKSLPKDSLLSFSKEVLARQAALSQNLCVWDFSQEQGLFSFRLHPVETDNHDIKTILHLFSADNPQAPLAFFSFWEMTKYTTPLGNQVWLVQAEAKSRWF